MAMCFLSSRAVRSLMLTATMTSRQYTSSSSSSFSTPSPAVYMRGWSSAKVNTSESETLEGLAKGVVQDALHASGLQVEDIGGLYVGNMLSGRLDSQHQVASFIAQRAGLIHPDLETLTLEAACGSGGAAIRTGVHALRAGGHKHVLVLGLERMCHPDRALITTALAGASDWEKEGAEGHTFVSLNGFLHHEYMERYGASQAEFFPFAQNAHDNAAWNENALFHSKRVSRESYDRAKVIFEPSMSIFDASPICNGAAAIVLSLEPHTSPNPTSKQVQIAGSGAATDLIHVRSRPDVLHLSAVERSAHQALEQAGLKLSDLDIFECHDAYAIMAALSLESVGFVKKGEALAFAAGGGIRRDGKVPIATSGGLKARGHPVGASGVYQACEVAEILRAGEMSSDSGPIPVRAALIQSIGGAATSVFAHALVAE